MTITRRFKINKLVRDKNQERLLDQQVIAFNRVMEAPEYMERLKDKLLEEAQEVISAQTTDEYISECADVLEVIHALAATLNISYEQIEQKRLKIKAEKGCFEGRIYSSYAEVDAENEKGIEYFLKQPDKYPEIE